MEREGAAMIDTIKRRVSGTWKGVLPSGWQSRESQVLTCGKESGEESVDSLFLVHQASGLRVWGTKSGPQFLECSLPRQVYPSNGYLLETQDQVDGAHARAVRRVADVVDVETLGAYTRVDTVWQFEGDPAGWVRSLSGVRWPYSRKAPRSFFMQSVDWMGDRVGLRIYDKSLEQCGKPGDVVRVELQANAKALRCNREKCADLPVNRLRTGESWLHVPLLYSWYRGHVQRLPVFNVAPVGERLSIYGMLAILQAEEIKIRGIDPVEFWLQGRAPSTARRTRAMVASSLLRDLVRVDMNDLLPEDRLPPVVHCIAA